MMNNLICIRTEVIVCRRNPEHLRLAAFAGPKSQASPSIIKTPLKCHWVLYFILQDNLANSHESSKCREKKKKKPKMTDLVESEVGLAAGRNKKRKREMIGIKMT